jgi:hypothetical protein
VLHVTCGTGLATVELAASFRCNTRHHTMAVSTVSASRNASAGSGRRVGEAGILRVFTSLAGIV